MIYPVVIQHDEMDCGAACLAMIGKYYGIKMPLAKYRDLLCFDNNGTTIFDVIQAAEQLKMKACSYKGTIDKLLEAVISKQIKLPCIALIQSDSYYHYIVIYQISKKKVKYADPADGIHTISLDEFKKGYRNVIISIDKADNFEKIKYKRTSFSVFNILLRKNIKTFIMLFVLSVFIILFSLCGSFLIEFTINSVIASSEASNHADDGMHNLNAEEDGSTVVFLNNINIIEKLEHNPNIVLYILLVIYGIRLFMELCKSFIVTKIACKIERQISTLFYEKMIKIPLNVFKAKKSGEFISRFTDVRKFNSLLADIMTTCIINITFIVGFGVALFFISKELFFYTLIVTLVFTVFTVLFQKNIRKLSYGVLQNNAQVISVVEETIKGIELIKTYDMENTRIQIYKQKINKYVSSLKKFANFSFIHNNIARWISSFGNFLIIYIGIFMCSRGKLSVSSILIYYILLSNFMSSISQLVYIQPKLSESVTAFRRVEDVLECESDIDSNVGEKVDNIFSLELKNVTYKYGLRVRALEEISLYISEGEKIMIRGKNGSGKSTLAHILVGNFRDINGKVLYNGKDNISLYSIRKNITYLNQDVFLFHDSIFNNIVFGNQKVSPEHFMKICKITGVDEFVNGFAEKYDYILCDNGANLSGGERRKIALARALLRDSPIYIFDESTSNLDEMAEKQFLQILRNYLKDKTILIISHNDLFKDVVDKIYIIEKGQLVEC